MIFIKIFNNPLDPPLPPFKSMTLFQTLDSVDSVVQTQYMARSRCRRGSDPRYQAIFAI